MKKVKKLLIGLVLLAVVYVGGFLLFGTLTDWTPKGTTTLQPSASHVSPVSVIQDSIISLLTWNVGYGGIGDQDFFFYNKGDFFWTDPGTVRMSKERVEGNVFGQEATVKARLADLYLLQEIDTAARRSHYTNQLETARNARPDYAAYFAANFKSKRVPLPLLQPWDHYGYVVGGLVNLSRFQPDS
ncbi:MAG: endonuclease/exonuclease/phosphatase family protein, partial [Bacteroidota bacterium]